MLLFYLEGENVSIINCSTVSLFTVELTSAKRNCDIKASKEVQGGEPKITESIPGREKVSEAWSLCYDVWMMFSFRALRWLAVVDLSSDGHRIPVLYYPSTKHPSLHLYPSHKLIHIHIYACTYIYIYTHTCTTFRYFQYKSSELSFYLVLFLKPWAKPKVDCSLTHCSILLLCGCHYVVWTVLLYCV